MGIVRQILIYLTLPNVTQNIPKVKAKQKCRTLKYNFAFSILHFAFILDTGVRR